MLGDHLYKLRERELQDPNVEEFFSEVTVNEPTSLAKLPLTIPQNKLLLVHYIHIAVEQNVDTCNEVSLYFCPNDDTTSLLNCVIYRRQIVGSTTNQGWTWELNGLPIAWPRAITGVAIWAGATGTRVLRVTAGGILLPIGTYVRR